MGKMSNSCKTIFAEIGIRQSSAQFFKRLKVTDIGRYGKKIPWIFGFYNGKHLKNYRFHWLISITTICILFGCPILMLTDVIVNDTMTAVLEESLYILGAFRVCIKLTINFFNLPRLRRLENLLDENPIFNMQTVEQDRFILAAKNAYEKIIKVYFTTTIGIISIILLYPFVMDYNFLVPVWIPNADADARARAGDIYESLFGIMAMFLYPSLNCLMVEYTFIIRVQFQILKDNLKHAFDRDADVEDFTIQERTIRRRLRACVIHENAITDVVSKFTEIFSLLGFCQVLFSTLELCSCLLQVTVVATSTSSPVMLFYSSCILLQIFIICWLGREIKSESSDIMEACYMTEWYTSSTSSRKMLFIIMENAKQPVVFKAGYFFELSCDTFITILRTGYSYYTVLSQLY